MLKGGVGSEDRVVRLDNGGGILGCWVDTELQLNLLAEVDGQALHEEGTETRSGSTTERVEDEEALEARAVIGDTADLVQDLVDQFLANGIVTTSIVVRGVLLSGDHQFGVEQGAVGAGADFVHHIGLEIAVDGTGDVFALAYCPTLHQRLHFRVEDDPAYRSRRRRC